MKIFCLLKDHQKSKNVKALPCGSFYMEKVGLILGDYNS